jgi:hypothetical protein
MNNSRKLRFFRTTAAITALSIMNSYTLAQGGGGVAVGLDLAAPIPPLNAIVVPDVNMLGILDGQSGGAITGAEAWLTEFGDGPITNPGQRVALQQLGKALFWDMQVGGDGIQSCASCHFHAGGDNRKTNQLSPGLKRVLGGLDPVTDANRDEDRTHDLLLGGPNATLTPAHYAGNGATLGLPADECSLADPALVATCVGTPAGAPVPVGDWSPDAPDGVPGVVGTKGSADLDVNDVVSSQGPRAGTYEGIACLDTDGEDADSNLNPLGANSVVECDSPFADTTFRVDKALLATTDEGFDGGSFTGALEGISTFRHVEPRNTPTAINAVYNFRNFLDGRADAFFNGVTPLGFRDADDPMVLVYTGSALGEQKLRIPFSSLASQAVGPIEADMEMVFAGRPQASTSTAKIAQAHVSATGR